MKAELKTDVVVIGGGAVGTSAAYHLSKFGKKVILCEARNIASGASGRCGGMVVHCYGRYFRIHETDKRLMFTRANTEVMKEYKKTFDIDFEFRQVGCLDIAVTEEEYEQLEDLVRIQRSLGDNEIELLNKEQTLKEMWNLNPDLIVGSRLRKSDGNLNPFLLCRAQAIEAKKFGAQIMTHTKVKKLLIKNKRIEGVLLEDGSIIMADNVVSALNAWTSQLITGTEIIPTRGIAMITEKLPVLPAQPFETFCLGEFVYGCTQTLSGNYNIGGAGPRNIPDDHLDEQIYLKEVLKVNSFISEIFPTLRNVAIIRTWAGPIGFTPDGIPSIGPMPGVKGLFVTGGYPAGMSWAAVSGKLTAEYICKEKTSIPLDFVDPGRFIGKPEMRWPQPYDLTMLHEHMLKMEEDGLR